MLILSQLTNGNTRNNNGLDLALAAALANAQQLNPDAAQANAKGDGSLAGSLLNSSTENKMFNLLENGDEISDKMLKLSNYLDALKNGKSKAEGDEEIVVDNESMSDETIAGEEEMADEEENVKEDEEDELDEEEESETVKDDEPNDQETDGESAQPDDEQPEETRPDRRRANNSKEAAASQEASKSEADDTSAAEGEPKENGVKREDGLDSTESSTESADEQRFKRRTRSSSLDHQNGTGGKHANERYYETDEEETAGSRQIELRKKGRRGRQSSNGTHLGSVVAKLSKKAEQHKSARSEEKEAS